MLPLPPFNLGLPKSHARMLLASVAEGRDVPVQRIKTLLEGHVAALYAISEPWAVALNMNQGDLLKKWAHGLLPLDNKLSGTKKSVEFKFASVGRNYIKRDKSFRSSAKNLTKPYTKWQSTAKRAAMKARLVL